MIKLSDPYIGEEELDEIKKVLDSKFLVQGDKVEEFECMVKEYLSVRHAIAVSSGTAALHLAMMVLGISSEDEVIVPDFTFPATTNVVEVMGATSKLVDIKLDSLCIDEGKIERNISKRTKVIMPVQEFGQSSDMDKIIELSKKYNIKVVEDAACALGAEYKGKKVGTVGDIGCFSLHPRKSITTGEGGILVTDNDEYAETLRMLRNHGISCKNRKNEFRIPGLNYRMTNIQGAMGIAQMRKLELINKKRIALANEYSKLLSQIKGIEIPKEKDYGKHIWQTYHIILNDNIDRNNIIVKLRKKKIETNFGAYAVHQQSHYKEKYGLKDDEFKNSIFAYEHGIALPMYFSMEKEDIEYVVDNLKTII